MELTPVNCMASLFLPHTALIWTCFNIIWLTNMCVVKKDEGYIKPYVPVVNPGDMCQIHVYMKKRYK